MDNNEKLIMDPIKPIKPIQIDADDTTTKYVLQGLFDERFYTKEVIDEKIVHINRNISNFEKLIDNKMKEYKLIVAEHKLTNINKLLYTMFGSVLGIIIKTYGAEIIKFILP